MAQTFAWMEALTAVSRQFAVNDNCSFSMLFQFAANFASRHITSHRVNGLVDLDKLVSILEEKGMTAIRTHKMHGTAHELTGNVNRSEFYKTSSLYSTDWAFIMLVRNAYNPGFDLHIMDASDNKEFSTLFETELFGMFTNDKEKKGSVFALMMNDGSLDLAKLGEMKDPLIRENYPTDAVEAFDHICACLSSQTPCGRIAMLDGPPGTGKSFMIRSLIHQVKGVHIIIPGSMVSDLSSPNFLSILHGAHEEGKPLVLIIEDADLLVVDRKKGNLRILSDVLNLGDGLLGQMLDIRIIASTNAKRIELDEAVTRPGRMCRHTTIGSLTFEQAQTIYRRLTEKEPTFKKRVYTLAEVYRFARQDGWVAEEKTPTYEGGTYA